MTVSNVIFAEQFVLSNTFQKTASNNNKTFWTSKNKVDNQQRSSRPRSERTLAVVNNAIASTF